MIRHSRSDADLGEVCDEPAQRRAIGQQNREVIEAEQSPPRHGSRGRQLAQMDYLAVFAVWSETHRVAGALDHPHSQHFLVEGERTIEIGVRAGMSDHFVSEAIYLTDPDGLGIEVYADRPREAWRYDDRQLRMATNHLDVEDVVNAAAGERWSGMPAGTVLGHVHLYVDDIALAEAFYHAALGFDKVVWSYPGALFMSAGGYHHHLGTNIWAQGAPPATDADARLLEWEIVVPTKRDADEAAKNVKSAGYTVKEERGEWVLTDPWGTSLRLVPEKR